jgi:hypothetical protein
MSGAAIDWQAPWFEPWRGHGEPVAADVAAGVPLHAALNRRRAGGIAFAPQSQLPAGTPYECYVFESAQCPVREGLHDFFNGLCWLQFAQTKGELNRLQALEIAQRGVAGVRGPVRDAITVFDENGAILAAPEPLWDALLARDWRQLFVELRPLWRRARLVVFGHALLEKLVQPRKDLTAHVWRANPGLTQAEELDGWLAAQMSVERLAGKPFTPLPVLGVPGWWAGNEADSFYDDPLVFRRRRA